MRESDAALAPLRNALLAAADRYVVQRRSEAENQAHELLRRAADEAADLLDIARRRGAEEAEQAIAGRRARVRSEAAALRLAAQRTGYDELRRRVEDDARALVLGTPGLTQRLEERGRTRLGASASVVPAPEGSVALVAGGLRWYCSPAGLAETALTELGAAAAELWRP